MSTTLAYSPGAGVPPSAVESPEQIEADSVTPQAPAPAVKHSFGYKWKHFWYKLFHSGSA